MSGINRKYLPILVLSIILCAVALIMTVFLFNGNSNQLPTPTVSGVIGPTFTPTDTATLTSTPVPTDTVPAGEPSSTSNPATETPEPTSTVTPGGPTWTPNPATETPTATGSLTSTQGNEATWFDIQPQLERAIESNMAYTVPDSMRLGDTVKIDLVINPSASEVEIVTEVVEASGYATSTAVTGTLVSNQGKPVEIHKERIKILNEVSAVLSSDPEAFNIVAIHPDPVQLMSKFNPTIWSWKATAKKEGLQTLTLAISVVVRDENDNEKVRLLKTYEDDISVEVTPADIARSVDWKWILGILLTALLIPLFFRWYDNRKKDNPRNGPPTKRYRSH